MSKQRVLYVPGSRWLQSAEAFSDSPQSWEESIKDLPGEIMDFEDALEAIDEVNRAHYGVGDPVRITQERWDEMLNVLPPCRWVNYGPSESFYVSEAITGSIHAFYIRIGDQFFTVPEDRNKVSHWELVRICRNCN